MNYLEYYQLYLNFKEECCNDEILNIISSEQRNIPICKYYYHYMINSEVKHQKILSCAPQLLNKLMNDIRTDVNMESIFLYLAKKYNDFDIRTMNRMGLNKSTFDVTDISNINEVSVLGEKDKALFLKSLNQEFIQESIANAKWESISEYVKEGRWFFISHHDTIISRAYVSDIHFKGGNISVWTDAQYLRQGYAKAVTAKAIIWCLDHNILPIYLVDQTNMASYKTAKSLGLTTLFKEIVVSKKIK